MDNVSCGNTSFHYYDYEGVETDSAKVEIDNLKREIKVTVNQSTIEPDKYLKDASIEDKTLIITKKDGTELKYNSDIALDNYVTKNGIETITGTKLFRTGTPCVFSKDVCVGDAVSNGTLYSTDEISWCPTEDARASLKFPKSHGTLARIEDLTSYRTAADQDVIDEEIRQSIPSLGDYRKASDQDVIDEEIKESLEEKTTALDNKIDTVKSTLDDKIIEEQTARISADEAEAQQRESEDRRLETMWNATWSQIRQRLTDDETTIESNYNELKEGKQDKLVSGVNIKTVNNQSILGTGNLVAEPSKYLKNVSVSGNSLVITKQDDSQVTYLPSFVRNVVVNGASVVQGDTAYITIPSLDGYATTSYVDNKFNALSSTVNTLSNKVNGIDSRLTTCESKVFTLEQKINTKQDKLTAGKGIVISTNNVISVSEDYATVEYVDEKDRVLTNAIHTLDTRVDNLSQNVTDLGTSVSELGDHLIDEARRREAADHAIYEELGKRYTKDEADSRFVHIDNPDGATEETITGNKKFTGEVTLENGTGLFIRTSGSPFSQYLPGSIYYFNGQDSFTYLMPTHEEYKGGHIALEEWVRDQFTKGTISDVEIITPTVDEDEFNYIKFTFADESVKYYQPAVQVNTDRGIETRSLKKYIDGADQHLQTQISALEARSDVVDIVMCYNRPDGTDIHDIVHYPTHTLTENDIIKVLQDNNPEYPEEYGNEAYYKWHTIGEYKNHFERLGSISRIQPSYIGMIVRDTVSQKDSWLKHRFGDMTEWRHLNEGSTDGTYEWERTR